MAQTILKTLRDNKLPFDAIPFPEIKPAEFTGAITEAIQTARQELESIKQQTEAPTFANTLEALEYIGQDLDLVTDIFFNLMHACTESVIDEQAPKVSEDLAAFGNDIQLDETLFQRIKTIYEQRETLNLTKEQNRLLENSYKDFVRNGALLSDEDKQKLRGIDGELAKLGPAFGQNLLKATNAFSLNVTDEDKVSALPASAQAAAKEEAARRGEEGYTFTLHAPSLVPFLKYMPDRELRQKLWMAYNQKAYNDEFSNVENCKQIASLRHQRAKLLGYKTHADFVLEKRMAKDPKKVMDFLSELKDPSIAAAKKEFAELQAFVKDELKEDVNLHSWDFSYYSEKYKKHLFKFDEEDLRPFFPLEAVRKGIFLHGEKLYGLSFTKADLPTYHPDVEVFEVKRDGEYQGLLYLDLFPRDNKRSGAWMTTYRGQGFDGRKMNRPHVSLVCNFTKPTANSPSLLTFNEVQTLFHEFGHGLHSLLSNCYYPSQAGTHVLWDFVELPSQIMENWTYEKEALDLFAKHYQTGDPIPEDLVKKLQDSMKFQGGLASCRQLSFGYLDMNWHWQKAGQELSVEGIEEESLGEFRLVPKVDNTNFTVGFSHIFAGGYSAGYYSYKWAEVLDADAFEYFKDEGVFNRKVADKFYDEVLSRGGTDDPAQLYKNFRGREPDPKALLRRSGLL